MQPTFYYIPYFQIGGLLLLLGLILGIVYIRNRAKTKRLLWERKLREQEQDRVRRRTAEDFHDEIGNKLARIKLLAAVAQSKIQDHPDEVNQILEQIKENAGALYLGAKDIIWSLQPESDYLYEIIQKIRMNAESLFDPAGIRFQLQYSENITDSLKMPSNYGRNLVMVLKEATHNIAKHARAKQVNLGIEVKEHQLELHLKDDGVGIDLTQTNNLGNGLKNMQHRMERLGGRLEIISDDRHPGTELVIFLNL